MKKLILSLLASLFVATSLCAAQPTTNNYSYSIPTTGFSYTIPNSSNVVIFNPAGTLAAGTVTMPPAPVDQQVITISTTQTITSLVLQATAPQTINSPVTTLTPGNAVSYIYVSSLATWMPTTSGTPSSTGYIQVNSSGAFSGINVVPVANGGTPYDAIVTNSPYNASGYIAVTQTSSSVSSGSTFIPLKSTTGFNQNQIAIIAEAGTSGQKNYAATIASVSAGSGITISTTALTGAALNNAGPTGTQSSSTATQATIPANFQVYTLGSTTTAASYANGATSITLMNAATYQKGQGIFIAGGAASGANLITTISSVTSNTVVISPGISNASGISSGTYVQHDDSAAFQAAVNLASYTQNIQVFVPNGYYQLNGPLNSGSNAVVQVPTLDYWPGGTVSTGLWQPQATVKITGPVRAPQMQDYLTNQKIAHVSGAVIQSNLGSTSNIFGGYDGNSLRDFTNVQLEVDNVTLRAYPNPNVVMINAYYIESLKVDGLNVDTGETGPTTQPGNVGYDNFAIIAPAGENGGNNELQHLEVFGFYWGIMASEHTTISHVRYDNEFYPEMFGSGVSQYGIITNDTEFDGCTHGIALNNNSYQIPFVGNDVNTEHQTSPTWATNVDDVADGSSLLEGMISIDTLSSPITISGGINLHVVNLSSPAYPLATEVFASLSNGHYATAPNGTHLYCSDCTATATCAGSGNGAMATRINSAWSCTGGLSAGSGTVTTTGSPATGNIAAFSSSTAITPATASQVVSLFSTCSGTQYLGADGACHTPSGSGTVTTSGSPVSGNLAGFTGSTVIGNVSSTPTPGQIYRPIDAQTGTTYTTVLSDNGSMVTMTNSSANTLTIPPNSSVSYPVGAEIDVCQTGSGLTTIAAGAGVTINKYGSTLALAGQYACATAKQLSTNTWILIGNL